MYNAEKYIARCLDSILSQNVEGLEIICVNDGSRDGSLAVLNEYAQRYPNIVKVIDQENKGVSEARNVALTQCTGNYIGFADADDYLISDALNKALDITIEGGYDMVLFSYKRTSRDGKEINNILEQKEYDSTELMPFIVKEALGQAFAVLWNSIYKYETIKDIRFFGGRGEDRRFNWMVLPKCKKILTSPPLLYSYEVNSSDATSKYMKRDDYQKYWDSLCNILHASIKEIEDNVTPDALPAAKAYKEKFWKRFVILFAYQTLFDTFYNLYRSKEPHKYAKLKQSIKNADSYIFGKAWRRQLHSGIPRIVRLLMPFPVLLHIFLTCVFTAEKVKHKLS